MSALLEPFRRDKITDVYWAYGERFGYSIQRDPEVRGQWRIDVREVIVTAGIRHTIGQPILYFFRARVETLALAKAAVAYFDADPDPEMWRATGRAYADEHDRRMAEIERLRAELAR